ncbi:Fur family transcriptional regulator [Roseibaca sp. Y0-43]|uniref:Fur family transcriptional regulator n=1 Tax=Roseibaca sp. Y0-43 TaxID=2816854 RepID=UPI001D0C67FA|nr:Fur family transcriptional regulator [Roseibaca sp. Y0-43]MCC1480802.1 transcriptional repressor [Roseibaca sp. Y0-43]
MTQPSFCCPDHSGAQDAASILSQAQARAARLGLRLTPVRLRTLEMLIAAHGALGAYDVLEKLAAEGFGTQPPVAYRALNWLVEHGFAHRIRRLNAFTACSHPAHDHAAAFLICTACDSVTEAPAAEVTAALTDAAGQAGFAIDRATIEAVGRCHACTGAAA